MTEDVRTPDVPFVYPSAPPPPSADLEDSDWHRLSPRMLLIHPILETGRALPALAGIVLAGSSDRGGGHWWGVGAAGVVILLSLSRWFTTRLRITDQQVQLRHGLLRRRTVTAARDRIRTVDVTSHLLHRVLGLARVSVGTGNNDRKGKGRIVLDGLTVAEAHRLRTDLLHARVTAPAPTVAARPGAADHPGAGVDLAKGSAPEPVVGTPVELARLNPRWIRYAPFTLSGVVTGLIVWGYFWRVQSESQSNLLHRGPLRAVTHRFESLSTVTAVVVVVVALALFIAITSTAGYVLAFWNFRLLRHDGGTLQVTRGLLTTRATSIERRRFVGVHLSEPLPLRWVGATRTTAVATGLRTGRGAERGGEVLLPPAPREVALAVAAEALDDTSAVTAVLVPHPPSARRRRLVRALVLGIVLEALGVVGLVTGGSLWPVIVGALPLVAAVPLAADRFANLGHAHIDGHLVTGSGSVVRRRTVLAEEAVIGWNFTSTVFQRRLGLTTLVATTAAGRQGYAVTDVGDTAAVRLALAITPDLLHGLLADPAPSRQPAASPVPG